MTIERVGPALNVFQFPQCGPLRGDTSQHDFAGTNSLLVPSVANVALEPEGQVQSDCPMSDVLPDSAPPVHPALCIPVPPAIPHST